MYYTADCIFTSSIWLIHKSLWLIQVSAHGGIIQASVRSSHIPRSTCWSIISHRPQIDGFLLSSTRYKFHCNNHTGSHRYGSVSRAFHTNLSFSTVGSKGIDLYWMASTSQEAAWPGSLYTSILRSLFSLNLTSRSLAQAPRLSTPGHWHSWHHGSQIWLRATTAKPKELETLKMLN